MKLTPRPEQEEAIQRALAESTHGVLLACEQDSGKTLLACEMIVRAGFKRVLVAGVKDTFAQWAERLGEQSDGALTLRRINSTKVGLANLEALLQGEDGIFYSGHQFLAAQDWGRVFKLGEDGRKKFAMKNGSPVVGPMKGIGPCAGPKWETKRKHLFRYKKMRPLDAIFSDEVQIHANRTSNGIGTIRSIPTDWRVGLSGTPLGNRFENAHPLCRWIWPNALDANGDLVIEPSIITWRERWVDARPVIGANGVPLTDRRGATVTKVVGERNPGEFVKTLPCYIRLSSPAGPLPKPELLHVTLSDVERQGYDQMLNEGIMWLRLHGEYEPLLANLPMVKRTRLRTAALGQMAWVTEDEVGFASDAVSTKMVALKGLLDSPDWVGRNVVIFTHSKAFAQVAAARMQAAGYPTGLWTGDVPSKKRDALKAAFIAGEVRYLVAVIESLSRGYDGLQTVCNRVVWLSRSDNNEMNSQAAKRVWRTGGDLEGYKSVEIVADDTYDLDVFHADGQKTSAMSAILSAI